MGHKIYSYGDAVVRHWAWFTI